MISANGAAEHSRQRMPCNYQEGRGTDMAKRILIVDDDKAIADMLEQTLLQEGYSARKTTQPLRFFDEVREFQPDLILLDLMMPYLDGSDELRLLGLDPKTSSIPVIMVTAHVDAKRNEEEYQAQGVKIVVTKPVDLNYILQLIRDTVGEPREEQ
jgi:CheY-like chemotaxis protein